MSVEYGDLLQYPFCKYKVLQAVRFINIIIIIIRQFKVNILMDHQV
jgi:hypothetical protein